MRSLLFISLINILLIAFNSNSILAQDSVPKDKIWTVIQREFGAKVEVQDSSTPYYLTGDFNGDRYLDLAVLVSPEKAKAELVKNGVLFLDVDPFSPHNGKQVDPVSAMGQNCLGVAIIHGTENGWDTNNLGKFMFYDCFSSFRIVGKGKKIRRGGASKGPTPLPKGDSIQLDLESGATAIIYWNGKTYRGFAQRQGD